MLTERVARQALIVIALGALLLGLGAQVAGRADYAHAIWIAGTVPVVAALACR